MATVADLWRLQEVDLSLESMRASFADAEDRLGEHEDLLLARARADGLTASLRRAQSVQNDIEGQADDLKAKIAPLEAKLYSGSIRNPKELADLEADVQQLKRHLSAVEDRDLDALAAAEAAEAELRAATAELTAIESAWREEQAELAERKVRLTGEIAEAEQQRAEDAAAVDDGLLAQYERLRRITHGRAVARLNRNMCAGCRVTLPTNIASKARSATAIVQCPNCSRILYP